MAYQGQKNAPKAERPPKKQSGDRLRREASKQWEKPFGERSSFQKQSRSFEEKENRLPQKAPHTYRPEEQAREQKPAFVPEESMEAQDTLRPELIAGRNPVLEALKNGRALESVNVAKGEVKGSLLKIIAMAKDQGIPVKEVSPAKLEALCGGSSHQGVAALASAAKYSDLEDLFARAEEKGEPPFFIIADELEDPHNLGAVIRTAEAAGAHGVIIPKRRCAGLTPVVYKTSAGAVEYLPVARVANLTDTLKELKARGVWIYAADMDGKNWCSVDYTGAVGLVIGSEGKGVGRLIREQCDFLVSLPMKGKINSLNASVAAGILMYEIARQREQKRPGR